MRDNNNINRIVHKVIQEELERIRVDEELDEGLFDWGRKKLGDKTYDYYDDDDEFDNSLRISTYDDNKYKKSSNSKWVRNDDRLYNQSNPKFCGNPKSVYLEAYKLGEEKSKSYIELLQDIRKRLVYYLNYGYFGDQFKVLEGVKNYIKILGYIQRQYVKIHKAAFTIHKKKNDHKMLDEGIGDVFRNITDQIRYKNTNTHGVRQKVKDNSGHKYAVKSDYKGQWMLDLANEINVLMKYNLLTGPNSLMAHKKMIEFLTVLKRGKPGALIPIMGVTAIAAGLAVSTCAGNEKPTPDQDMQPEPPQTEVTTPSAPTSADAGTFKSPTVDLDDSQLRDVIQNAPQNATFELLNPNDHTANPRYNQRTAPQINKRLAQQRINQLVQLSTRLGRGDIKFVFNGNLTNSDTGQIRLMNGQQNTMDSYSPSYNGTATNFMDHVQ